MKDLLIKSGFSSTDNQLVNWFGNKLTFVKPDHYFYVNNDINNIIYSNHAQYKKSLIVKRKPVMSTNTKLNKIIFNLEQKNMHLREQFLDNDNNKQNECNSMHRKILDLLKRNKMREKKKKEEKNEKLYGIRESIKRLIIHNKKYALNEETIQSILKENSKSPSLYRYSPNYFSINKHIPSPDLSEHNNNNNNRINNSNMNLSNIISYKNKNKNNNNISNNNLNVSNIISYKNNNNNNSIINISNISYKNKNNKNRAIKSSCNIRNMNKYKKIINKINKNRNENTKNIHNVIHSMDSKYIKYNDFESKKKDIQSSVSMDLLTLNPDKKKSIISIPNFSKMISREKNSYLGNKSNLADYFPNYNAIYPNANKFMSFNKDLKEKKNKLRKIISSSNPPKYYLLLPSLNKSIS